MLKQLANTPSGSSILDAGCGNGTFAKVLAEQGFDVAGFDLSDSGIAHARRLAPECRFEQASVYDDLSQLFECQFDVVVSFEVVEHLYDPRSFVRRVHECLRPGGTFILSTPYHGWLKNLVVAASGSHDKHFSPLHDGGHIKFWSRHTLSKLLEERDFKVRGFEGAGRLPYLWKSMILTAEK